MIIAAGTAHAVDLNEIQKLKEMGFTKSDALYFGDSNVDMQTAKNSGIKAIGVTWGFRSREELEKEGADVIINSPSEIEKLI